MTARLRLNRKGTISEETEVIFYQKLIASVTSVGLAVRPVTHLSLLQKQLLVTLGRVITSKY